MALFYRWVVEGTEEPAHLSSWEPIGTVTGPWTERSALEAARRVAQADRNESHLRVIKWESATFEQRYAAVYEDLIAGRYPPGIPQGHDGAPDLHALARAEAADITPVRPFVGVALHSVRWLVLVVIAVVGLVLFRACSR